MVRSIVTLAIILALAAPAQAGQRPIWTVAADQITVIDTGTVNGLTFATVRDNGMHGHNVYEITAGAHIGALTVTTITATGVVLSNGRVLPAQSTTIAVVQGQYP